MKQIRKEEKCIMAAIIYSGLANKIGFEGDINMLTHRVVDIVNQICDKMPEDEPENSF